jgi:hypothetical protein
MSVFQFCTSDRTRVAPRSHALQHRRGSHCLVPWDRHPAIARIRGMPKLVARVLLSERLINSVVGGYYATLLRTGSARSVEQSLQLQVGVPARRRGS